MHRRSVLKRALSVTGGAAFGSLMTSPGEASVRDRAVVIVRQGDALLAVDPVSGKVAPCAECATPVTGMAGTAVSTEPPAALRSDGEIDYWMQSDDGSAVIYRRSTGSASSWWWLGETSRMLSELPPTLEPGLPSGSTARWFHGASVVEEHIGTGSLRLLAVDIVTGEVALDEVFDRRLELAATTIGDDGSVVAHLQGGNTRIQLWMADLLERGTMDVAIPVEPAAPVAPSAIELAVARDDRVVVAAGLSWSAVDHPEPFVVIVSGHIDTEPTIITVTGELAGIGTFDV